MKPLWWKERRKIVLACNQTQGHSVLGDKILPTEALVFLKCSSIGHNTYNTS